MYPQVRVNRLARFYQEVDPKLVHVPLVGGPDLDIIVPLFTRTTPMELDTSEAHVLTPVFRGEPLDFTVVDLFADPFAYTPHLDAFALNMLVRNIAIGRLGIHSGYRTTDTCVFMASPAVSGLQ